MAQNEVKAKAGLPERVRLNEGLGFARGAVRAWAVKARIDDCDAALQRAATDTEATWFGPNARQMQSASADAETPCFGLSARPKLAA